MTEHELDVADVMDLSPVQVDDEGRLFISPVIHNWTVVTERDIDTVVDLEGGLDIGVPTVPNECLYVYFRFFTDSSTAVDVPRSAPGRETIGSDEPWPTSVSARAVVHPACRVHVGGPL